MRSSSKRAAADGIADQPDGMAGRVLRRRKVGDVAENAADRAPRDMDDGQLLAHRQPLDARS